MYKCAYEHLLYDYGRHYKVDEWKVKNVNVKTHECNTTFMVTFMMPISHNKSTSTNKKQNNTIMQQSVIHSPYKSICEIPAVRKSLPNIVQKTYGAIKGDS